MINSSFRYLWHIVSIIVVAIPLILLLDRRPALQLFSGHIVPEEIKRGMVGTIVWQARELRTGCDGEVKATVVDSGGVVHDLGTDQTIYHPGTTDKLQQFSKPFTNPFNAALGVATYISYVTRWCNPLQHLLWSLPDTGMRLNYKVVE